MWLYSRISLTILHSRRHNETVEHIINYGEFMVSYVPLLSNAISLFGHGRHHESVSKWGRFTEYICVRYLHEWHKMKAYWEVVSVLLFRLQVSLADFN